MPDDFTMCTSEDCPIATTCRRHEASGAISGRRQSWTTYHWRRHRVSERVICNGFEEARKTEVAAG